MCPVSGVSRNEGLDSRLFSVTSAHAESGAAGGSCFPSHPRKRLPVLPRAAGGSPPAVAAEHIWRRDAPPPLPGRGRRCAAPPGVPAQRRFPGRAAGISSGHAPAWRGPGAGGRPQAALLPGALPFGRDPAVLLSCFPAGKVAVGNERPGWSCRDQVLARAACVWLCVCPGFVLGSGALSNCTQALHNHPTPRVFFYHFLFFVYFPLSPSTFSWIMNVLFFHSFLPISKQRFFKKVSAGLLNSSLGFLSFFSFLIFFSLT